MKRALPGSVSDTCRHVIGRHARGVVSSDFVTRVVVWLAVALEAPFRRILAVF